MYDLIEKTIDEVFKSGLHFPEIKTTSFLRGYDFYEKDDAFHIEFKVPGFSKKDISIDIDGDILHMIADSGKKDEHGFRSEVINKKLKLFNSLALDTCKATLKDVLLTVSFKNKITSKKIKIT